MKVNLDWQYNYHITSLKNRTHMINSDIKTAIAYISKKYNLDTADSLKKLINYAIDGKLILKKVTGRNINSVEIQNKLMNLNDL